MSTLTFNEVNFNPVERNGQIWLTSTEIAKALGYARTDNISRIYNRNKDEFTGSMTATINMVVKGFGSGEGNKRDLRIFSLRGCHLLAMFARTDIAKQFRKWVLDILDKEVGAPVQLPSSQLTSEQTLPLRNAVNKLVGRSGIMYPEGYKIVHQQFGVKHIKDLTLEQLAQAIEYVHDRILSLNVEKTPISSFTHNQYIMNVKHEVMDYVYSLQKAIVDSGSPLPKYPRFDKEEICQAFIVSMIQSNRMMLSFDHNGKPNVGFIPQEHAVVSRESLSSVVQFADKSQLPSIINEAVRRLGQ
ncbi:Phage Rha protein [Psychrobacter nivimaris]|uniref:Phage Rha protein n=1 Tax=Psychrobacter nivimaris TaxID=281738 RepID=A0A6N7BXN6_9GAMM|nr:BRO family protein [Psychrobacter nivimaris]KAF0567380.1 Phage Rha protein [Psychrobacter nivimaris]